MRTMYKLVFSTLIAALLIAAAGGTATALRSIELGRGRATIALRLDGRLRLITFGGLIRITCTVELTGVVNNVFAKREGAEIGRIREGEVIGRCEGGEARVRRETLPWVKSYRSFNGTLPNITGIVASTPGKFQVRAAGLTCNYSPTAIQATAEESRGGSALADQVRLVGNALRSETEGCPEGELTGTLTLREEGPAREFTSGFAGIRLL